jgi:hypothetical protein
MQKVRIAFSLLTLTLLFSSTACAPQTKTSPTPTPGTPIAGSPGTLGKKNSSNFAVTLSSNPAPPIWGLGTLEAIVTDAAGRPITDAQVFFDLDMTNMRMGKNIVAAASQGEGHYIGRVRFSMPGPWRVIVRIARPGLAPEDLRFEFSVKFR